MRSNVLCQYGSAHTWGDKAPASKVQPQNPAYPRVHVVVNWHPYLESDAKAELSEMGLLKPGTPLDGKGWSAELEAKMKECNIAVHGNHEVD